MRKLWYLAIAAALVVAGPHPLADEGMWTFDNPPRKIWKEKYGFDATDQWLEHVRLASVRLSDGASGSFVSPDGLLMTNQHVAAGQLQKLSTKEKDYTRDGFYAATRAEELKCPDLEVYVLVSLEEVTGRVQGVVPRGASDRNAAEARKAESAAIEKESVDRTGLRSEVIVLYNGGEYWLYRYKKYTDLRLVFAPEEQIAFFGGDYDNFTYPRYDFDVTFLRAYENGAPARTPHHFTWSARGADEKDLVFLPGNPGSTARLLTLAQIQYHRDTGNPLQMQVWTSRRDALARYAGTGPEAARRAGSALRSLENSIKRLVGQQDGLRNPRIMARKEDEERALRKSVAARPDLFKAYGTAWDEIARAYKAYPAYARRIAFSTLAPSRLGSLASTLVRYAEEVPKPNAVRYEEFRDTRLESLRITLLSPAPIYPDLDEAVLTAWLDDAQKTLGASDPFVRAALGGQPATSVVKAAVAGSRLAEVATRKALLDGGPSAIRASDDPLVALARRVEPVIRQLRAWQEANIASVETSAGERIARARFAVYGRTVYPDANFTLRIEYGTVLGYEEDTTLVPFRTTFHGLFDRAEGFRERPPYSLPPRWKERKAALDLATPLNFVYTADTIGGNSGSPVINRRAEIVGINFDSNLQKLANRYLYIPEEEGSRAVGVHSMAITEALTKVYDASGLVAELLGRPATAPRPTVPPEAALRAVAAKFAPDQRHTVFTITTEQKGDALVVRGNVEQAAAKEAALNALRAAGYTRLEDGIGVVPDAALGDRRSGIVSVSVAHMRSRPSQFADQVTEAMMGSGVTLLKREGGWYYVKTDVDRYLGWIEADHVAPAAESDLDRWTAAPKVIATALFALVRERPSNDAPPVADLVVGNLVRTSGIQRGWHAVELPDGRRGFVERRSVEELGAWLRTRRATPETIEAAARQFMGVPYLWGGTSAKGFDCSGFVKIVCKLNGLELPRDADEQALEGQEVAATGELAGLRKGDLVCFKSRPDGPDRITHIGIYLGGRQFIHCAGKVKLNSFDPSSPIYSENLLKRLVTVRRIITS